MVSIREAAFGEKRRARRAKDVQHANYDGNGAVRFNFHQRRAQRRARAHHIIDERHTLAEKTMAGCRRQPVTRRERRVVFGGRRRCEVELAAEKPREQLGEERAAGERSADGFDLVSTECLRELGDEGIERGLIDERRVEIEPQTAVQTRLHPKMATVALARGRESSSSSGFQAVHTLH